MIEAQGRAAEDFVAALSVEARGCSVIEQTDAWVCFEIASDDGADPIRAIMEKLVNLDTAQFGAGSATRTALHHMSVIMIRRAGDRLAVIGMRSLADSLWHALETAARHLTAD